MGKAFSVGLDKSSQGHKEEGAIKLLKDIRDRLAGVVIRPNRPVNDDNDDNDRPDNVIMIDLIMIMINLIMKKKLL